MNIKSKLLLSSNFKSPDNILYIKINMVIAAKPTYNPSLNTCLNFFMEN